MTEGSSAVERKRMLLSMLIPFMIVAFMWLTEGASALFDTSLHFLGIYPGKVSSLTGIITSPLVHSGVRHLFNNTLPLFILGTALFYFYSQVSFRVLLWITFLTGLAVWVTGRPAWHIGASGIVYGLASFLFVSGIIRRHIPLMALSLLVAFVYGEMVWGIFPGFRIDISWESHMLGAAAGVILAVLYRGEGPQKPVPFYEKEEEEEEKEDGTETGSGTDNREDARAEENKAGPTNQAN
ncbi:MAG: rhomboid family intramembrane serine protease [Bacteroidales bacterium]|jgi:membrane associated rhomboid family serine protease|nr:rhomboid family intramembrane serine protease [Bacteroidales bacterium]